jgi:hypothetical protein
MLNDKVWLVRQAAASALGEIGPEAKIAIPALTRMLKEERGPFEHVASTALGRIGPAGIPAVTRLFDDEEEPIREAAARALGQWFVACGDNSEVGLSMEESYNSWYFPRALASTSGRAWH